MSIDNPENKPNIDTFIRTFWDRSPYAVDENFAEYMVTKYLKKLESDSNMEYEGFLNFFVDGFYSNIWRLVLPFIDQEDYKTIGEVALAAKTMGEDDIAKEYKRVFQEKATRYNENFQQKWTLRYRNLGKLFNEQDGFLYSDVPIAKKVLLATVGIPTKMTASDYEDVLSFTKDDASMQKKIIKELVLDKILEEKTPLTIFIPILVKYLNKKQKYKIFSSAMYHDRKWATKFLDELSDDSITPEYWDAIGNNTVTLEIAKRIVSVLGNPTSDYVNDMLNTGKQASLIVLALSPEEARKYSHTDVLTGRAVESPDWLMEYLNLTGLSITEALNLSTKEFYNTLNTNEALKQLLLYTGSDIDWDRMFDSYISTRILDDSVLEKLLDKVTTVSPHKMVNPLISHLREITASLGMKKKGKTAVSRMTMTQINEMHIIKILATPETMKLLTPGQRREVQKIINEYDLNKVEEEKKKLMDMSEEETSESEED